MAPDKLAIEGGRKAAGSLSKLPSKLGKEELFELIDLWSCSKAAKARIKKIIAAEIEAQEPVLSKIVEKYYPPDVAAIKYYLGNREPERWPKNGDLPGEGQMIFYTQADVKQMLADEQKTYNRVPPPQKPNKKEKQNDGKGKKAKDQKGTRRISKGSRGTGRGSRKKV